MTKYGGKLGTHLTPWRVLNVTPSLTSAPFCPRVWHWEGSVMHHVWTGSGLFQEKGNFVLHPKAQWDNTDLVLHTLCPVLWDYKCKLPHMQTHFQSTHSGLTSPFTPAFFGVSLSALTFPLSFLHPQGGNNLPSKSFPLSRCHSN